MANLVSDPQVLILYFLGLRAVGTMMKFGHRFHFEEAWIGYRECENIVQSVWELNLMALHVNNIANNLEICVGKLSKWNRFFFQTYLGLITSKNCYLISIFFIHQKKI